MARSEASKGDRSRSAARAAVKQAGGAARERGEPAPRGARKGGDPFTGELRRREVLPLLVMHLIAQGPSYGNQLMERIAGLTEGVLSVNPNTMYPLLRRLEDEGLIEGQWEHPDRRSRRFYSLTERGRDELERLAAEVEPFLDSMIRSVSLIKAEIYERDE